MPGANTQIPLSDEKQLRAANDFPHTKLLGLRPDLLPLNCSSLRLINHGTPKGPTTPPFYLTKQAVQSRSSSEPLTRWRPVISTLITAPLLRTDSLGRCCCRTAALIIAGVQQQRPSVVRQVKRSPSQCDPLLGQ